MRRAWLAVTIVLGAAGCGSSASSPTTTTATHTATASPAPAACRNVPVPPARGPQHLPPPHIRLDPNRTYTVTVVTNCGTFAFALDVKQSPKTSGSIYSLVKRGFFNGLTFHRVAAGFVRVS